MAGYVIHIIIAEEYIRKHGIENKEEFIEGTIYPDSVKIKGTTHYSPYYSSDANLYDFLLDRKLDNSYNLGYFLHLVVDVLFYNKYFILPRIDGISEIVHHEYDILNKKLQEKYNPYLPEEIRHYTKYADGKLEFLNENKIYECIEEASDYDLVELAEKILKERDYKKILGTIK